MTQTNVPRPGRPLLVLLALLAALYGSLAVLGTWAPQLGLDLQGGTSITLSAQTVDGAEPTEESLDEAVAIIRQRVNGSGVAEAEVTTQGTDTIVVQVPGVGQDELVALVGQTAELQFRPVLAIVPGGSPVSQGPAPTGEPTATPTPTETPTDEPTSLGEQREDSAERASRSTGRTSLTAAGTPTPTPSPTPAPTPAPIAEQPGPTAEDFQALTSFDCASIEPGQVTPSDEVLITCDRELANRYLLGPADVVGTDIADATAAIPQGTVAWQVNLEFTSSGAEAFFASTQRLAAQAPPQNQFAIVLDGLVVSAPRVNEPIPGGRAQITGQFTQAEATAQGKEFFHHVTHLLVHGVLHLLGYDHHADAEAELMEMRERAVLRELGIPDPYQERAGVPAAEAEDAATALPPPHRVTEPPAAQSVDAFSGRTAKHECA